MRFALPGDGRDGDPGDAVLDRVESQTDASGVAHVVLTAPSMPAGFDVRASAGKALALQSVRVGSSGYTTLARRTLIQRSPLRRALGRDPRGAAPSAASSRGVRLPTVH